MQNKMKEAKKGDIEAKYIFGLIIGLIILVILFLLLKKFGGDIQEIIKKIGEILG